MEEITIHRTLSPAACVSKLPIGCYCQEITHRCTAIAKQGKGESKRSTYLRDKGIYREYRTGLLVLLREIQAVIVYERPTIKGEAHCIFATGS